ncbi:MAG TPA: 50S ribosomal protein L25 [Flavobacteriales bacterium]|nr:50S ribosomal protein L25 [Flavobacteriales bacterium]
MKTASLSGSLREGVGKKDADALRASNRVPGVLYGGAEQIHFSLEEVQLNKLVFNPDVFKIELDIDGKKVDCIIQDIQFHPVTDRVTHIDLLEVLPGKPVKVALPLRTTGQAIGVMNGGRLELNYRRVPVRGIADDLPECLTVDITPLKIGDSARVRDLNVEGLEILLSDSALLVACKRTRAAMSAESALEEGEEGAAEGEGGEGEGEGGEGGDE